MQLFFIPFYGFHDMADVIPEVIRCRQYGIIIGLGIKIKRACYKMVGAVCYIKL